MFLKYVSITFFRGEGFHPASCLDMYMDSAHGGIKKTEEVSKSGYMMIGVQNLYIEWLSSVECASSSLQHTGPCLRAPAQSSTAGCTWQDAQSGMELQS